MPWIFVIHPAMRSGFTARAGAVNTFGRSEDRRNDFGSKAEKAST
jgi:hypothetical protein